MVRRLSLFRHGGGQRAPSTTNSSPLSLSIGHTMRNIFIILAAVLTFAAAKTPASAHVTLEQPQSPLGSYKAVFRVPHGCGGSATHTVIVDIPEGVIGVKPMPKPGWKIDMTKGAYAQAYEHYHGKKVSEGVKQVTWSGGHLPNDYYDEFIISTYLPSALDAGRTLYFKVTQLCDQGSVVWGEIPAPNQNPHDLEAPAVPLTIAAKETEHTHASIPSVLKVGNLTIETPWLRASPAGAKITAGYLTVSNTGADSDRLVSVSFPMAGKTEIHEMSTENGVMKMRAVDGGLEIKPGEKTFLAPGGLHLMLMQLAAPIQVGDTVKGALTFEKAGRIEIEFNVAPPGTTEVPHKHHH